MSFNLGNLLSENDIKTELGYLRIIDVITSHAEDMTNKDVIHFLIELEEIKLELQNDREFLRVYRFCRDAFSTYV